MRTVFQRDLEKVEDHKSCEKMPKHFVGVFSHEIYDPQLSQDLARSRLASSLAKCLGQKQEFKLSIFLKDNCTFGITAFNQFTPPLCVQPTSSNTTTSSIQQSFAMHSCPNYASLSSKNILFFVHATDPFILILTSC